jgi:hypothetical protein
VVKKNKSKFKHSWNMGDRILFVKIDGNGERLSLEREGGSHKTDTEGGPTGNSANGMGSGSVV